MNGFPCTWKPQATASFHIKKLDGYRLFPQSKPDGFSMFLPRKPDEYVHARHYKNISSHLSAMLVPTCRSPASQLFIPAHSPSELAHMHVQPITLYLLLRHWMLPAFIQITGIFFKNGFSYEYHYDLNQLSALYLKMLALKGRLSLHSKDDCIVRLWLRCDGCDFTLNQTRFTAYT